MIEVTMQNSYPDLYSFITKRKEKFGGFLFNPYLQGEIELDNKLFRILELCNGLYSTEQLISRVSKEFLLNPDQSKTIVIQALEKFNAHYAINWRKTRKEGIRQIELESFEPAEASSDNYIDYYSAPLSVIFELTHACNLNCAHCLVSAGKAERNELSTSEVKSVLDQLHEMKVFSVNFGGGEPLLRKDLIEILEYASNLNFGIILSTNGLLVDDKFLDILDELNAFSVQVSVDGPKEIHDVFRGKQGSYNKAMKALKSFAERGYHTTMSTMILKKNIHAMEDLLKECISCGIPSFKLSSYMPAGRGADSKDEHVLTREELKDFSAQISALKEKYKEKLFIDDKATYPFACNMDYQSNLPYSGQSVRIGCSAARSSIVISPEGLVYACPFYLEKQAGDLRAEKLKDMTSGEEAGGIQDVSQYAFGSATGEMQGLQPYPL